jgi:hypothetical protein
LEFARAAKTFNCSNARFFPNYAGKKGSPIGEQPTNSTGDHGIAAVMPAWTAGIQVRRDASGDIRVNLGSGTPCRNDDIEKYSPKLTKFEAWRTAEHEKPSRDLARYDKHLGFSF